MKGVWLSWLWFGEKILVEAVQPRRNKQRSRQEATRDRAYLNALEAVLKTALLIKAFATRRRRC